MEMCIALKDDRAEQYSIRVNDQWRICFRWQGQDAFDVEIVDYSMFVPWFFFQHTWAVQFHLQSL
jgi:hypothetical protein